MKFYTTIYRNTVKLTQGVSGMIGKIQTYFYNKKSITTDVNILYQDGLYSVNTDSKILAVENDVKNLYSLLYQDTEALKIIQSFGLQEKDILLGRNDVYAFLQNAIQKITLNGNILAGDGVTNIEIDITSKQIGLKNDITDLKTILTQNIAIDNAFFASLSTALATSNYTQFKASLSPTIAGYIAQKNTINTLILSLLK